MNFAADFDLAPEKLGGLRLEDMAIVVPVDEIGHGEQRTEHQNQNRGQTE